MAVKWTSEQREAIETTDRGVIVSAAAGSGKTAVLIERTISMLCDEEKKIPADKLLAVTFTKDATNQMKNKLTEALEKKLEQQPENAWLQQQQDNLALANINTINAFCLDIVKTNIHEFEFQSGIKIIEDAEVILNDSINEALEYYFEHEPDEMNMLIDALTENDLVDENSSQSANSSKNTLIDIVSDLYYFLRSLPFPDKWCERVNQSLTSDEGQKMHIDELLGRYEEIVDTALESITRIEVLLDLCSFCEKKHIAFFEQEREMIEQISESIKSGDWEKAYMSLVSAAFKRMIVIKPKDDSEDFDTQKDYAETISLLRKNYRDSITAIQKEIKTVGLDVKEDMLMTARVFEGLCKLYKKTQELSWEKKIEQNKLEFSDVEIMTVGLLCKYTDEGIKRTELAEEMVRNKDYQVILIDEFQDVNNLQELIFKAISDTDDLRIMGKNVFVVGDVKQSIYRFRQSNPLLFINTKDIAEDESVESLSSVRLSKNFRSRKNVLDYVNYTFSLLMSKDVGEIEYNEDEMLRLGADYAGEDHDTEIMLVRDNQCYKAMARWGFDDEHYAIARRIKDMLDEGYPVYDNGAETSRPCECSDFCVLSRGKTDGALMAKALEMVGLKAYSEDIKGYLRSREIAVMINLLKVIDNPMKDIALVSVMMSSVFGFDADETAKLKLHCKGSDGKPDKRLYQLMNSIATGWDKDGEQSEKVTLDDKPLEDKCIRTVECIKRLRFYSSGMPLERLIRKIYDETDFFAVASTFENSKQKRANLRLLLELASSYENNSEGGVAGFIRYLESASRYGGDFKQAVTVTEGGDSVVVKTMHSSKGLEFAFVFLCGLSRKFNKSDESKRILLSEKLGFSAKISNHKELSITQPVNYVNMKTAHHFEAMSEELRLLYVAMTRAKEKLFVVLRLKADEHNNTCKKIQELAGKIMSTVMMTVDKEGHYTAISPEMVSGCNNYAEWVLLTLLCAQGNEVLLEEADVEKSLPSFKTGSPVTFSVFQEMPSPDDENKQFAKGTADADKVSELVQKYEFKYPSDEIHKPAKMTVTEIVRDEKEREYGEKNPEFYPQLPRLADEIGKLSAAEKGTYTHLFMELADYDNAAKDAKAELERLYSEGFLTKREKDGVYVNAVKRFFESDLYKRMAQSDEVMREKSFLVAFDDLKLSHKYDYVSSENGMLQGIADCIFKEDDGYVLVDYKTDNFKSRDELYNYQTQLQLYKAALELILEQPVKSCYIYSFKLCDGVEIKLEK